MTFSEIYICAIAGTLYGHLKQEKGVLPYMWTEILYCDGFPMSGKIGGNSTSDQTFRDESLTLSPAIFFRWEVIGMPMREDSLCYNTVIPVKNKNDHETILLNNGSVQTIGHFVVSWVSVLCSE